MDKQEIQTIRELIDRWWDTREIDANLASRIVANAQRLCQALEQANEENKRLRQALEEICDTWETADSYRNFYRIAINAL